MERIEQFVRKLYAWARTERLGRRRYVLINVQNGIIGFLIAFAPLFIVFLLPDLKTEAPAFVTMLVAVFAAIGMLIVYSATSLARLRDMGAPPAWLIAGLVPYLNIVFFVWLAYTEGARAKEKRIGAGASAEEKKERKEKKKKVPNADGGVVPALP